MDEQSKVVAINSFWELMKYWCKPMYLETHKFKDTSVFELGNKVLRDVHLTYTIFYETKLDRNEVDTDDYTIKYFILLTDTEIALLAHQKDIGELTTEFYPLNQNGWQCCVEEINSLILMFVSSHKWIVDNNKVLCLEKS